MIIVMGGPEQQFKAQQIIYKRLLEEDQRSGTTKRERRLKVLFPIPNDMLGRVIGKGGAKIKELAGTSGARLRLVRPDNQVTNLVNPLGFVPSNLSVLTFERVAKEARFQQHCLCVTTTVSHLGWSHRRTAWGQLTGAFARHCKPQGPLSLKFQRTVHL